jgi:hypothetical protein
LFNREFTSSSAKEIEYDMQTATRAAAVLVSVRMHSSFVV